MIDGWMDGVLFPDKVESICFEQFYINYFVIREHACFANVGKF